MRGDVDGDGRLDRVSLALARGPAACRFVLVADLASGRRAARIYPPRVLERAPALRPLRVLLRDIDREAGLEIVVADAAGASSVLYDVFTVHHGSLVRLTIPDARAVGQFYEDQALGHAAGVDCLPGGRVLQWSSAQFERRPPHRSQLEVNVYRATGSVFRRLWHRRLLVRELPALPRGAFESCSGTPSPVHACPRTPAGASRLASLPGDVDGDGRTDRVSLLFAPRAPAVCGFFLVVRSRSGTSFAHVPGDVVNRSAFESVQLNLPPRLYGVRQIDGRRGGEVVVVVDNGASSAFFGLWTMRRGSLLRMRIDGDRDTFVWDGGGTHHARVDCLGGGRVLQLTSFQIDYRPPYRWSVTRDVFRSSGASFVLVSERRFVTRRPPSLRTAPFGSCPRA